MTDGDVPAWFGKPGEEREGSNATQRPSNGRSGWDAGTEPEPPDWFGQLEPISTEPGAASGHAGAGQPEQAGQADRSAATDEQSGAVDVSETTPTAASKGGSGSDSPEDSGPEQRRDWDREPAADPGSGRGRDGRREGGLSLLERLLARLGFR